MGLFRKKHDITDIYGIKSMNDSPFTRKDETEAPETGRRHSDYYHKYFRGYTEVRRLNEKGRVAIERYYTRPWIVSGLSPVNYWLLRLLYVVLTAASAAVFIVSLSQKIPANYSWMIAIPGYASIVLLFLLVAAVLGYVFVERKMTLWGHTSSTSKLKKFSIATAIGQALTAILMLVFALSSDVYIGETLVCVGMVVIAAVCTGVIYLIERRVPYTEVPNETKLPTGEAHEIW